MQHRGNPRALAHLAALKAAIKNRPRATPITREQMRRASRYAYKYGNRKGKMLNATACFNMRDDAQRHHAEAFTPVLQELKNKFIDVRFYLCENCDGGRYDKELCVFPSWLKSNLPYHEFRAEWAGNFRSRAMHEWRDGRGEREGECQRYDVSANTIVATDLLTAQVTTIEDIVSSASDLRIMMQSDDIDATNEEKGEIIAELDVICNTATVAVLRASLPLHQRRALIDSGASICITPCGEPSNTDDVMTIGDFTGDGSRAVKSLGTCTLVFGASDIDGRRANFSITDCHIIRGMSETILSPTRLVKMGWQLLTHGKNWFLIHPDGTQFLLEVNSNNLLYLNLDSCASFDDAHAKCRLQDGDIVEWASTAEQVSVSTNRKDTKRTFQNLHRTFGHASMGLLMLMLKHTTGITLKPEHCEDCFCPACAISGSKDRPYSKYKGGTKAKALIKMLIDAPLPTVAASEVIAWSVLSVPKDDLLPFQLISMDTEELPALPEGTTPFYYPSGKRHALKILAVGPGAFWVASIKLKSDSASVAEAILMQEGVHNLKYDCTVITDGCGTFSGDEFSFTMRQMGIIPRLTPSFAPNCNPIEGASNRLDKMARTVLLDAPIFGPREFPYALKCASQTIMVLPARGGRTPYERLYNKRPDVSKMFPFGNLAYVHVPKTSGRRGTAVSSLHRAEPARLLFYKNAHSLDDYHFLTERGTLLSSAVADFVPDEAGAQLTLLDTMSPTKFNSLLDDKSSGFDANPEATAAHDAFNSLLDKVKAFGNPNHLRLAVSSDDELESEEDNDLEVTIEIESIEGRVLDPSVASVVDTSADDNEPTRIWLSEATVMRAEPVKGASDIQIEEALKKIGNPKDFKWQDLVGTVYEPLGREAYAKELNAVQNGDGHGPVLRRVLPADPRFAEAIKTADKGRVVGTFKQRFGEATNIKARLCKTVEKRKKAFDGAGFDYGINTSELQSLRLTVLSHDRKDRDLSSADADTAFLQIYRYGERGEKIPFDKFIWILNPWTGEKELYEQLGPIYGESSAPRRWQDTLHIFLKADGWVPVYNSPSDWYHPKFDMRLFVWVDDLLLDAPKDGSSEAFYKRLQKGHKTAKGIKIKPVEYLTKETPLDHVGLKISLTDTHICISMGYYVDKIIAAADMVDCQIASTPINAEITDLEPLDIKDASFVREINGMAGWLANTTRPDIAYTCSRIAQHNAKPCEGALKAVKYLVRYLAGTRNLGLRADLDRASADFKFFVDADHAGNSEPQNERRSQLSHVMMTGTGVFAWKSSTTTSARANQHFDQTSTAQSSGEAEIFAYSEATKAMLHMSYIAEELHIPSWPKPMLLQCDATTALAFAENRGTPTRLKHLEVRQAWILQLRDTSQIIGIKVDTLLNKADLPTKMHPPHKFKTLIEGLLFEIIIK